MEKPSKGSEIKITTLKGINLRSGRNRLSAGECDRIYGLYPSQTGLLGKMPGKTTWRVFEQDEVPSEVLQVGQIFDGTGNIVIQAGDTIGLYSLDELLNRQASFSLSPSSSSGANPPAAIIAHTESAGTNGGSIGATDNVFYTRTLNTLMSNGGSIVTSLSGNSFTLGIGTYRIKASMAFGKPLNTTHCRMGLWSVSQSVFKLHSDSANEIFGVTGAKQTAIRAGSNDFVTIMGRFTIEASSETFQIRQAYDVSSAFGSSQSYAQGYASDIDGKDEVFTLIKITKE